MFDLISTSIHSPFPNRPNHIFLYFKKKFNDLPPTLIKLYDFSTIIYNPILTQLKFHLSTLSLSKNYLTIQI